jgi:hypothetical protein
MVIKEIIKQITPEKIKQETKLIQKIELPLNLQKWIKEYKKVGGERGDFTWKLFWRADKGMGCVKLEQSYQAPMNEIKFLMIVFIILLDDAVDKNKNKKLLKEFLKIPFAEDCIDFSGLNEWEKKYLNFILKIWSKINQLIKKSPRYSDFKDIFKYDINQVINAMNYDYLVNANYNLISKTEYWLYSPHSMYFFVPIAVYLMYLPQFNINDLGIIREASWQIQKMARIGNWISTWEREIEERDFSSGVFAHALHENIITTQELSKLDVFKLSQIIKDSGVENELFSEWQKCYDKVLNFSKRIKVIDIKKLLGGLEYLMTLEMLSKSCNKI